MEILLKGSTKISMSPRKFEFSNILIQEEITPLSDLESKGVYDRVSGYIYIYIYTTWRLTRTHQRHIQCIYIIM